jgi:hypothetical protein
VVALPFSCGHTVQHQAQRIKIGGSPGLPAEHLT